MTKWNTIYGKDGNIIGWSEDSNWRRHKNTLTHELLNTKSKSRKQEIQYELNLMSREEVQDMKDYLRKECKK